MRVGKFLLLVALMIVGTASVMQCSGGCALSLHSFLMNHS